MSIVRRGLKVIDSISWNVGSAARWLTAALVAVGAFDTMMRYVFNAPTVWAYETCCMLGGGTYVLGWAYTHLRRSHIRVDVLYGRLSQRGQAVSDVILAAVFFFPLILVLMKMSIHAAIAAWKAGEVMIETYWYPPAGPFRTAVAVGVCLFFLQGVATFVRDLYFALKGVRID
ncbi:MAG: TRAP transporter small permease subunit [Chloroflexota bacterium]